MLDPRIMSEGLEDDCTEEEGSRLADLEAAKAALRRYFDENYSELPSESGSSRAAPPTAGGARADFTARYAKAPRKLPDELEEFWRSSIEPWDVDPIKWWFARRSTYPRLSKMALNILSIPGPCPLHPVAAQLTTLQAAQSRWSGSSRVAATLSPCVARDSLRTLSGHS